MRATLIFLALVAVLTTAPSLANAAAATCTENYYKCLNDTYEAKGFEKFLADAECLTEYIGCVRRKA